jgi:uncharacterized protein YdeI (YjbR/CyaY-like superfamily)
MPDAPELVVKDEQAWREWLDENEETSDGVWLVLAKKGVTEPTSLTYEQALQHALCSGWIDGQVKRIDDATFRQRWTPRRTRSIWSQRNVARVAVLIEAGRMRPRGFAAIERAKADGRWDAAYAGPATATIPDDLAAALKANPPAAETLAKLDSQNRYAVLFRVSTARTPALRAKTIDKLVAMLAAGEGPYPRG